MRIYDLAKFGTISFNLCLMCFIFARSPESKGKVEQVLLLGNVEQTRSALVVAIMPFDMKFYDDAEALAPAMGKSRTHGGAA